MSTTYYPQTDGQSEDLNKCIEQYMRCFVSESPHEWALYGREPPTISRYVSGSAGDDLIEKYMLKRDDVLVLLKNNLSKAQTCMKLYVDARRTDLQLEVGDWAFVKLKPYRQLSLRLHHHHKLRRKYFGPYQVLKRIVYVAYKLDLPAMHKFISSFIFLCSRNVWEHLLNKG
ncbi:hypothetical protein MTR67_022345 [Solanum verrucosum]|uniref:Tf2-1-like SH3-like domain-containing protein n=1 Tax=Solanum verrucosum TaxID=315347 RepID=A0AAF0TWM8_SOLVR|nr:hypothetical protein MTR67_022345 [Solanum verrucosum]